MPAEGFIDKLLDVLALIIEQPRTAQQLIEATGYKPETVYNYLSRATDRGMLYIERYHVRGSQPVAVYAMQQVLFEKPNAVLPATRR